MSDEDIIRITEKDVGATPKGSGIVIREIDLIPFSDDTAPAKEPVDIMLVIDTSGSMGADDYSPNRLASAKEAAKMFARRKVTQDYNDRVGVIGFGGSATVFHPLDSNLDKVASSIDKLRITHSGTMIGTGLRAAQKELGRHKSKRQAIVLLSDGGDEYDSSKPLEVARSLKGIKVFAIGIGTLKGGMAKLPHGRQKVFLNEKLLKQSAKVTGGEYLYAPDVPRLQQIYTRLADY